MLDKDIKLFFDMIEDDYLELLESSEDFQNHLDEFEKGFYKVKEIVYNHSINNIESKVGSIH